MNASMSTGPASAEAAAVLDLAALRRLLKQHGGRAAQTSKLPYRDALLKCAEQRLVTEEQFEECKRRARGKGAAATRALEYPAAAGEATPPPTANKSVTKVKGFTSDALKTMLANRVKVLKDQGDHKAAKDIKRTGTQPQLADRCCRLGLITEAERDAPVGRTRAVAMTDEERAAYNLKGSPVVTVVTRMQSVMQGTKEAQVVCDLITNAVFAMHQLSMHATHLVRLWALRDPHTRAATCFKDDLYRFALEAVSAEGVGETSAEDTHMAATLRRQLKRLYDNEYAPLLPQGYSAPSRHRLTQCFRLEGQRLAAAAKTNVKEHFADHVRRFVNVWFSVKRVAKLIGREADRKAHFAKYDAVKRDLLRGDGGQLETTDPTLQWWVNDWRACLPRGPYKEDSIAYDVKCRPEAYMPMFFAMARALERNRGGRLFQVLPLRLSNTPCHAIIDTEALESIVGWHRRKNDNLTYDRKMSIWDRFLRVLSNDAAMEGGDAAEGSKPIRAHEHMTRIFRRGKKNTPSYVFRGSIVTDGLSVSLPLVRTDLRDLKGIDGAWKQAARDVQHDDTSQLKYIDYEDGADFRAAANGKRYVVGDGGIRDLMSFRSSDDKTTLRYTNQTRKCHMKQQRYRAIREELHNNQRHGGRSIQEWDAHLGTQTSRAVRPQAFKGWIGVKMACLAATAQHWQAESFRRLKSNAKINARRSEDVFMNVFKTQYGQPSDVLVVVGDWSKGSGNLKHSPPGMRRGFINVLRRHGYDVWVLKEAFTSKRCSSCHQGDCMYAVSWESGGKSGHVHGLLRCKNDTCKQFHNRNANATSNMLRIVQAVLHGQPRPTDLCRAATAA